MNWFAVLTDQLVPETSHVCHGLRYRFLPVPVSRYHIEHVLFATGYRYETRAVIGERITHTNQCNLVTNEMDLLLTKKI